MRSSKNDGDITIAVVGSMTTALAAQRALATAAIRSEIVKEDSAKSASDGRGCSYGVAFPGSQRGNVRAILSAAHINVRRYTNEEWQIL